MAKKSNKEKEVKYEVMEEIETLSSSGNGKFETKVCMVSWFGKEPKLDIRTWNTETNEPLKGICLTEEEALQLMDIIKERYL